jgi:hypothetical protein
MKNIKLATYLFMIVGLLLSSCSKDDEEQDSSKPIISNLEVGLNNSKLFYQGGEVHLEFEAADNEELGYYEVHIHNEEKAGSSEWEFENRWDFDAGLKNALVHHHEIEVPDDADLGQYHFHLTLVDKTGNTISVEEDVEVHESTGGAGPEIHVDEHPDDGQMFQTGEIVSIKGHIHGEMYHLAGVLIAIVDESDNLADDEVNDGNSIVLLHTHDFSNPEELDFDVSITVGAAEDNNHPTPNPISDWNLHDCYILIKAKDENDNWSYSQHFHIHVMD